MLGKAIAALSVNCDVLLASCTQRGLLWRIDASTTPLHVQNLPSCNVLDNDGYKDSRLYISYAYACGGCSEREIRTTRHGRRKQTDEDIPLHRTRTNND